MTDMTVAQLERLLDSSIAHARRSQAGHEERRPGDAPPEMPEQAGLIPAEHEPPRRGLIRLSTVTPVHVDWLWTQRVPLGKVTVLDGDPGLGKSTITLDLAARVSSGRPMPGERIGRPPAGVVLLSAEDGLDDTIRPRLDAAGADVSLVFARTAVGSLIEGHLPALPDDIATVEADAVETGAALIVVDPLMAFLAPGVNAHRDQDVRRALAPLAAMAERTGAAVLVVRHLNKSGKSDALYRGGGSIGIIGAARCGLMVAVDPDDESQCVLAVTKSNLGAMPAALSYRLVADPGTQVARIDWGRETTHTARALLAIPVEDGVQSAVDEAIAVLAEILQSGPVRVATVRAQTRSAGISDRTLDRAKSRLGVTTHHFGRPGDGGYWEWALPERRQLDMKDANPAGWRTSAADGALRPVLPVEFDYPRSAFEPD